MTKFVIEIDDEKEDIKATVDGEVIKFVTGAYVYADNKTSPEVIIEKSCNRGRQFHDC